MFYLTNKLRASLSEEVGMFYLTNKLRASLSTVGEL